MRAKDFAKQPVITIFPTDTVVRAAVKMREHHVGSLVVVAGQGAEQRPVGMLTDRDIVVGVVAQTPESLDRILVGDAMSRRVATVKDTDPLDKVFERMTSCGVRRMPVIDGEQRLVGVLAMDDLVEAISKRLNNLVDLMRRERNREVVWRV